jgi:signal transduction histidine kinase
MIKKIWGHLKLNQKIVLPFLAISLSILTVGVLLLGYWFTQGLERSLQGELKNFAERVQQDLIYEQQVLVDQLKLIATQDPLQQAIERQDKALLLRTLLPLKASLSLDWVKVVNSKGIVLLDVCKDGLNSANFSEAAIRNSAIAGANLTDLVFVKKPGQPQVLLVANHPIKTDQLLGGIIIGRLVNDALLQKIATGSSKQLLGVVDRSVIAKTLPHLKATTLNLATNVPGMRVKVDSQGYLAKAFTLDGSQGSLAIWVLYPVAALESAKIALWLRLGLMLLLSGTIAAMIGSCIARAIARPIQILTRMTQQLAQGNTAIRIPATDTDEIGQLSKALNQLAEQLTERGVMNQQIHQLEQTLSHLEQSQDKLIHAEKMASLGQLVAGIAHEINTPLGAIRSSIGNIANALEQTLREFPPLLQTLPSNRLCQFFTLLDWARRSEEMLSSREERQLKRNIQQTLRDQGIPAADLLADTLSKMGITTALTPILPLLQEPNATDILETAYQLSIVQNNSQNIQLAVEQATRIVYALKNYVRQDVAGIPTYASIAEGIDTVLTLYQNQIKRGIRVEKHYAPVPKLLCYPEELAQVWSNLISNAIQAMNYQGQLVIAISEQNQQIVVQLTDTGEGIAPDIKARIFEPFFTTKAMGEGTGLGLSIVKNIVDKHQGQIEVESASGLTVFRVRLPIASPLL